MPGKVLIIICGVWTLLALLAGCSSVEPIGLESPGTGQENNRSNVEDGDKEGEEAVVENENVTEKGPAAEEEGPTRDAAYWPFSIESPWNMPLGDEAELVEIDSPGFDPSKGAGINCAKWSHPIFIATENDPKRIITQKDNPGNKVTIRIPQEAMPDGESDGHMHIIDETHTYVVETWVCKQQEEGNYIANALVVNQLKDDGVYKGWHGTRAYGGSAIAGLIRKGELINGIPHALALATNGPAMNMNAPDGKHWVWPASSCDGDYKTSYGTEGNLFMGSLLAIPLDVNLDDIKVNGKPLSLQAYNVAYALQHYGGYIVDRADANLVFYAEPAAQDALPPDFWKELSEITKYLKLVNNNTPQTVGGPGERVEKLAPPFQK